jgi:hypothetical protein
MEENVEVLIRGPAKPASTAHEEPTAWSQFAAQRLNAPRWRMTVADKELFAQRKHVEPMLRALERQERLAEADHQRERFARRSYAKESKFFPGRWCPAGSDAVPVRRLS